LPSIDIALPFYGDVEMMKAAVQSVLRQSDKDWRLIMGDDGYPDPEVQQWIKGHNDSRILYFRNEVNLGANKNFQKCLSFVEADYVVVMGADDLMNADFISTAKQVIAKHPDASMYQPRVSIIDEMGERIFPLGDRVKNFLRKRSGLYSGESICASLMNGNWLYFPSMVWRTSDVKDQGFRAGLNVAQDLGLAIDLLIAGKSIYVYEDEVFQYRRHSGGDSAVRALTGSRFQEERNFFSELAQEFTALNWHNASRAARVHITSRLNAAAFIPLAIRKGKGFTQLLKHVVS
jgi:glycosyltransferase involved in cell wall biosynthesis